TPPNIMRLQWQRFMSVLFFHTMKYSVKEPKLYTNDRFILSKGHAAPILYAGWAEAGLFPASELLNLRKISSDLEGHPTPRLSFVDVATGSLGQGPELPRRAWPTPAKHMDKLSYRVFCVIGDGESAEGSIWEAARPSHYRAHYAAWQPGRHPLDVERLASRTRRRCSTPREVYKARIGGLRLATPSSLEGRAHVEQAGKGFIGARTSWTTTASRWAPKTDSALAKHPGRAVRPGPWPLSGDCPTESAPAPLETPAAEEAALRLSRLTGYKLGEQVATRLAYGNALVKAGGRRAGGWWPLDGDTKNSTFSLKFAQAFPRPLHRVLHRRAEHGRCRRRHSRSPSPGRLRLDPSPLPDAHLRPACAGGHQPDRRANFAGSHAGVSIGEDGRARWPWRTSPMFALCPAPPSFYRLMLSAPSGAVELAANTSRHLLQSAPAVPNQPVLYAKMTPPLRGQGWHLSCAKSRRIRSAGLLELLTIVGGGRSPSRRRWPQPEPARQEGIASPSRRPGSPSSHLTAELLRHGERQRAPATAVLTVGDHYPEGGLASGGGPLLPGLFTVPPPGRLGSVASQRQVARSWLGDCFGIDSEAIRAGVPLGDGSPEL
uniref:TRANSKETOLASE_1 domain-containing protein n=1 Tax=Macrostomum lignano TaxID=282301 RepID=A0A1I8FPL0_9PLAT